MIVAIRWVARVWGLVSIGLVTLILAGEIFSPHALLPTADEWVGLFLFPFSVCAGMVIAWRREGLGGSITVGSLLLFYVYMWAMDGRLPQGPYFALIAAPGALFLLVWGLGRHRAGDVYH